MHFFFRILFVTALLLADPTDCLAVLGRETPKITTELLQMIWSLALVIGLILLFYAFFRKKFSLTAHQQNREIKIIEMRPLPGKKSLCLVEVGCKRLLLGVTGNAISSLAEFPKENDFAVALQNCHPKKTGTTQQQEQH